MVYVLAFAEYPIVVVTVHVTNVRAENAALDIPGPVRVSRDLRPVPVFGRVYFRVPNSPLLELGRIASRSWLRPWLAVSGNETRLTWVRVPKPDATNLKASTGG